MENWHVDPFATTTAEALICSLAGVCNGASTWDGSGFSKLDASFGHSLADKAANSRPWTTKQALAALKLVRKYRKQLGGDDFINKWLETPVFKMTPADQAFTKATDHPNSRKLYSQDQNAIFTFVYDADLVSAIKTTLKGEHKSKRFWASWDPIAKSWSVPVNETSIWNIMELAERFDFEIEPRFVDYFDKVKEKTAESRTMLAVNDGRHIVLVDDTIMISVNNAAILEEFENELGIS